MKESTIMTAEHTHGSAAVDSARKVEEMAHAWNEPILKAGGESDQRALAKRLDVLCTRLGARNAAIDADFDETVGDGL